MEAASQPEICTPEPTRKSSSYNERYSVFPIRDEMSYKFYKQQETIFWSSNDLIFIDDKKHYDALPPAKQRVLDLILAFFLPGDGMINNNIVHRFLLECQTTEETMMFTMQLAIEVVHAETYGLMVYTLYDERKIAELHHIADTSPYMVAKFRCMERWTSSQTTKAERLLAFACAEGIFFCNLFLYVFWFRADNVLPTIIHANELIRHDELLHRDYNCYLHVKEGGIARERALQIVEEFVQIETQFSHYLVERLPGTFRLEDLSAFVQVTGDQVLTHSGYDAHYNATNPFPWMEDSNLVQKNNFFEVRAGNYVRASISDALNWKARAGKVDVESDVYNDFGEVDF